MFTVRYRGRGESQYCHAHTISEKLTRSDVVTDAILLRYMAEINLGVWVFIYAIALSP